MHTHTRVLWWNIFKPEVSFQLTPRGEPRGQVALSSSLGVNWIPGMN
jgi:hypothetical protein